MVPPVAALSRVEDAPAPPFMLEGELGPALPPKPPYWLTSAVARVVPIAFAVVLEATPPAPTPDP